MKRGPVEYQEGRQRFSFDNAWLVTKYDDAACSKRVRKVIQGAKAVDFCGKVDGTDAVFFIEVKDFRTHHIDNVERIDASTGNLATEVAKKVHDSIAGLIGSAHFDGENWETVARHCGTSNSKLIVVLWMELDSLGRSAFTIKPKLDAHLKKLKEKLRWTGARIMVVNEQIGANLVPHLTVTTSLRP